MKGQTRRIYWSFWVAALWLMLAAQPVMALGIGVDRSPVPPHCILNDGSGVELYDWEIQFDSTPDHYIEILLDPDYGILRCVYHDLSGWTDVLPAAYAMCTYVDESGTWPQSSPVIGANSWSAPAGAKLGRYEIRIQYFSFEVGNNWEAEGAVTFYVCQATGSLRVSKWHDLNANGVREQGEPGIPMWKVSFTDPFGATFNRLTDANGEVVEGVVPIGHYDVWETVKKGWTNATPLAASVGVLTNKETKVAFGNYQTGSIGDQVFYDDDKNGLQEGSEEGIPGVALHLFMDGNGDGIYETLVSTETTDEAGWYLFDELPEGRYMVDVDESTLPAGELVLTTPPEPHDLALAPEENYLLADFGYYLCRAESCNGLDDDCDGQVDEDFPAGEACDGADGDFCANGTWTCTEDGEDVECVNESKTDIEERCNGMDDDCDGQVDEDFPVGEPCDGSDSDECETGTWTCTADRMGVECVNEAVEDLTEQCNGLDDDCDGQVDEDFPLLGMPCDDEDSDLCAYGRWECFPPSYCRDPNGCDTPTYLCVNDEPSGMVEVCDAVDNDCDGETDEGLGSTTCGVGLCEVTVQNCVDGQWQSCQPGIPTAEVCDLADNDCDGLVDENLGSTTCGVGACEVTVENCVAGVEQQCVPGAPAAEACDLVDNDCDGAVDEGLGTTTCGMGVCQETVVNCVDGQWQNCEAGQPSAEVCDGLDNDCDGLVDEALGSTTCGIGVCETTVENCVDGQVQTCVAGEPAAEICDGLDNDCDGLVDEALGSTTCGVGLCEVTVDNCVAGEVQECVAGTPTAEVCDLADNDCDGLVDEELGTTECGIGACYVKVDNCVNGQVQSCVPGTAVAETCDLVDNDCDGLVDEELGTTECGIGACYVKVDNCVNGQVQSCVPGTAVAETCDLVDNDCDGLVDEELGATECGVGACAASVENCVDGQWQSCVPGDASAEVCDLVDNDCDGAVDEGLGSTTCGIGACEVTVQNCIGGVVQECVAGTPAAEVCDLVDNDCDGAVDEGLGTTTCGVGACEATVQNCVDGVVQKCVAGTPTAETCDLADNDCDGLVDEDLGTTTCGVGACEATVDNCVNGQVQSCVPGDASAEVCDLVDNDCDGAVDEGLGTTTCGVGACEATVENCVNGVVQECIPGNGSAEICDLVDNDCDGAVDEELGTTTCGVGACEATVENCVNGVVQDCVPGQETAESCDGVDNDCDGFVDEELGSTTCGVGACEATVENCVNGQVQSCVPGDASAEVCDLVDNDCDGAVDEELGSTTCGVGACEATVENCVAGVEQQCVPGDASAEVCDLVDNDCDGAVDEDLGTTTCGAGACQATVENCVDGQVQSCVPGDVSAEVCDGIDNDCDGAVDEGLGSTTCGVGACEVTVENCVNGQAQECVPGDAAVESCDGIDNDCDGAVDEELGSTSCGVGACQATVENCVAGEVQSCQAGEPTAEVCDGIDNDCDGVPDEDLGETTCGVGACERTMDNCVEGSPQECLPGEPVAESCDGEDNDCDGAVDEGLGATTCGQGVCEKTVENCVDGQWVDCVPGEAGVEVCDGLDNDCDGLVDEDLGTTTCGIGACEVTVDNCVAGEVQECVAGDPAAEICDGIDNDCDGAVDEALGTTTCGVGACEATVDNCVDGVEQSCVAGEPAAEVCDGIDNDCDGGIDEDLGASTCGVGACEATVENCVDGQVQACVPGTGVAEVCDGIDNDCDGSVDEGLGTSTCGVGACAATVENCVDGVAQECLPGAPAEEVCDLEDNDCDGLVDEDLGTTTCGVGECEVTVSNCDPTESDIEAFGAGLPGQVTFVLTHPGTGTGEPSYFDVTILGTSILAGVYDDWCVDTDNVIQPGATYTANVYSSYGAIPAGIVEFPENFDMVNYIINQGYPGTLAGDGTVYTYSDVQRAIWTLIDDGLSTAGLGPWSQARVDEIVNEALAFGEGYEPECGEYVGVILQPVANAQITIAQVTMALVPEACDPNQECIPGEPTEEVCDGLDNDCDGETDEELGSTTCGVGECEVTVENCVDGAAQECVPGEAVEELCDGLDNDCDGEVDEELGTTTCGQGVCQHTIENCVDGVAGQCDPFEGAGLEVCDGLDNDCDGLVDEGFSVGEACVIDPCGYGTGMQAIIQPCTQTGTFVCAPDGTAVCETGGCNLGTVWQLGTFDFQVDPIAGGAEYPTTDAWTPTFDYTVTQAIDLAPNMPGYLSLVPMSQIDPNRPLIDGTAELRIHFELTGELTGGVLHFSRYGSEVNTLYVDLDDIPLAVTSAAEGQNKVYQLALPTLDAGWHEVAIVYGGGGAKNGNYIDAIRLVGEFCELGAELCGNGLDDNCNCDVDEGFEDLGESCSAGIGGCFSEGEMVCGEDGLGTACDAVAGEPTDEVCDGVDNDCDGEVDEELGETTCGQGECVHSVPACVDGAVNECDPFEGADVELCDGLDNDCDGTVDEDCYCVFGVDLVSDSETLANGQAAVPTWDGHSFWQQTAADLPDSTWIWTEYLVSAPKVDTYANFQQYVRIHPNAIGITGDISFSSDNSSQLFVGNTLAADLDFETIYFDVYSFDLSPYLEPGENELYWAVHNWAQPWGNAYTNPAGLIYEAHFAWMAPQTDEVCDGLDNDCDGEVDEGLGTTTCGIGACEATVENCVAGEAQECVPGTPQPEVCDGIDNDCDGEVDEDLGTTTCGIGACEATVENCVAGEAQACVPGTPVAEVCDLVDNDCDGAVDEELGTTTCGVGECEATVENCVAGVVQECVPGAPAVELCDALDNDCDGAVDEGFGLGESCSIGGCGGEGIEVWAVSDENEPLIISTGDAVLTGSTLACNFEHNYAGMAEYKAFFVDTVLTLNGDFAPNLLYAYGAYDGADWTGMDHTLDDMVASGDLGSYDMWDVSAGTPLDLQPGDLAGVDVVILDAAPDTAANHFVLTETTKTVLRDFQKAGGKLIVSAYIFVYWHNYVGYEYQLQNTDIADLVGDVLPDITKDAWPTATTLEPSPHGAGETLFTLIGAEPWHKKPADPFFHEFWVLDAPEVVSACYSEGVYVCAEDGGVMCNAEVIVPGDELCDDGIDNDCDCEVDEGFEILGQVCSAGLGACYAEGQYVCSEDGTSAVCDAVPGEPTDELCDDGIDNDCDGETDEGCVCPHTIGYWKNHADAWPVEELELGGVVYTKAEAIQVLKQAKAKDATKMLAAQLVASKLNVLVGGPVDIVPVIDAADAFLVQFPYGSDPQGDDRAYALDLKDQLDEYNNASQYDWCECEPDCDDKECGSNGCGGSCGTCDDGFICNDAYACECDPSDEICDGVDNDCDGLVDEGLGTTTCGVGECQVTVDNCVGGEAQACVPGTPVAEACDGLDNDCDGAVDNGFGTLTCGVGACVATVAECVDGVAQECVPGTPVAEACDLVDNDCDGAVDEDLGASSCGQGICAVTVENCVDGVWVNCEPGTPQPEVCDGVDNDCDGLVDEDLGTTSCGAGACKVTVQNCVGGQLQSCVPGTPSAEVCDGIDNDCDSVVDEGLGTLSCGVGECEATVQACIGGQTQSCVPGTPVAEACDDYVDNDCDGSIDEGCEENDDCLLPPTCVSLAEAFARDWIVITTPAVTSSSVTFHNLGSAPVCLDEHLLFLSDPTQSMTNGTEKANGGTMTIPAGGKLTMRYAPWTYANGYYQPYLNQPPWWCVEYGQLATANTYFGYYGEEAPEVVKYYIDNKTNVDGDGKEDHVDWAGKYGTQTLYNVWNYQAGHTVLTAGKVAGAAGPGTIGVVLTSHNMGGVAGQGILADTVPAGWWVDNFSVDPDGWVEHADGSVTMYWNVSLVGYEDVYGWTGTTIFDVAEYSYDLHPAWSVDGRRVEIPRAEVTYFDGQKNRTGRSAYVVAINVDVDGDGFAACGDCDDGWEDVYPGAEELCDGVDNDCDGDVDEGCPVCGNGLVEEGELCDNGDENANEPYMCQTNCTLSIMWPGDDGLMTIAYEDLPLYGGNDWDYNDWIFELEVEYIFNVDGVVSMALYADPWARGAAYHHSQGMAIAMGSLTSVGTYQVKQYDEYWNKVGEDAPVAFGTDEDIAITLFQDTWDVLPPNSVGGDTGLYPFDANTESGYGIVLAPKVSVEFIFDTPLPLEPTQLLNVLPGDHCENLPYDLYMLVQNTGEYIANGDVRMLCIPKVWDWPAEKKPIWTVYGGITPTDDGPVFDEGWYLDPPIGSTWYSGD